MKNKDLSALYRIRFTDDELLKKNAIWRIICQDFLKKFIKNTDVILEIGCGFGEFLNNINGKKKFAIDLNSDAKNFLNSNIEFHNVNATNFVSNLNGTLIDVVFTSNFLEHLPDKASLNIVLDEVMTALKAGGKFIILGPNLRYLPGQYWDFYDHHLGLTHLSLSEALKLRGYELEVCIDRFLPFTTQSALPTNPWLVAIYLKVPILWRLLGKQFFIVAKKPS
jgi:SAM-dependent methyltransferase